MAAPGEDDRRVHLWSGSSASMAPLQVYYFRFQARTRKGLGDFADAVKLMVI